MLSVRHLCFALFYLFFFKFQAGITDEERHRQAKTILLEMGQFFQVQVCHVLYDLWK
jgi:hypothetical protein